MVKIREICMVKIRDLYGENKRGLYGENKRGLYGENKRFACQQGMSILVEVIQLSIYIFLRQGLLHGAS